MEISQLALARLHLFAFLLGAALGGLYDLLRLFRLLAKREKRIRSQKRSTSPTCKTNKQVDLRHTTVTFLADFFFSLAAGIALILLLYQYNNGKLRLSVFLCVAVGGFFYRATLGRLVLHILETMAQGIKKVWRIFVKTVFFPLRLVLGMLQKNLCKLREHLVLQREHSVRRSLTRQAPKLLKKEMRSMVFADTFDKKRMKKEGKR